MSRLLHRAGAWFIEGAVAIALTGFGIAPQVIAAGSSGAHSQLIDPLVDATVAHEGLVLTVPAGSVDQPTTITVDPMSAVHALGSGMANVTEGWSGYQMGPDGMNFTQPVLLSLPYDPSRIPEGLSANDVYTFFYDVEAGRWRMLERVMVDPDQGVVVSATTHFTDFISATLAEPDHPRPTSFDPTSLKELKAADPGAGINLVEPPSANSYGTARLQYPIEIPPGRGGMQPALAVVYDSTGANGWMGIGWDLPVDMISVDTLFGVPRYHGAKESETYRLNGQLLAPMAPGDLSQPREAEKSFHARVEGGFNKIIRHGDTPWDYWWEVIDKTGTRYFYGGFPDGPAAGLADEAVLADPAGAEANIFAWALCEVRDTNGNTIRYHYEHARDTGVGSGACASEAPRACGVQLYLSSIRYTGRRDEQGEQEGPYEVTFLRGTRREDVTIDNRPGFKVVTADRLAQVEVKLNGQPIRHYEFEYEYGAFRKTRLAAVRQFGADTLFHTHVFEYYDELVNPDDANGDDDVEKYTGFAESSAWMADNDVGSLLHDPSMLGGTRSITAGGHLYSGFNPCKGSKSGSLGSKFGYTGSTSEGLIAFVDVNGDQLPDKIFSDGDGFAYRYQRKELGPNDERFSDRIPVNGLDAIYEETSHTISGGFEAYPSPLNVMVNISKTFVKNAVYLSDVNGDGLIDVVDNGRVRFGYPDNGGISFSTDSSVTPVPLAAAEVDTEELVDYLREVAQEELAKSPLIDAVRRWTAPFGGQIRIAGAVRLVETVDDPDTEDVDEVEERAEYETADGVRVAIQHENTELWSLTIAPDDYTAHMPLDVDAVNVQAGDDIYFRVQSLYDGAYDEVEWAPVIEYLGTPATTDVNALDPSRYSAEEDFVLVGRRTLIRMPLDGTVRFSGPASKRGVTTDDVTLVVKRNGEPIVSQTVAWNQIQEIELDVVFHVEGPGECVGGNCVGGSQNGLPCDDDGCPGDVIECVVEIDSPIDMSLIDWAPELVYIDADDPDVVVVEDGQPLIRFTPSFDADLYPARHRGAAAWRNDTDQTLTIVPEVGANPIQMNLFEIESSELVLTVKRRGQLVSKRLMSINQAGAVDGTDSFTVAAQENDELFFAFSTRDGAGPKCSDDFPLFDVLTHARVRVYEEDEDLNDPDAGTTVPSSFYSAMMPGAFSEPYRGWAVTAYNGSAGSDLAVDQAAFDDYICNKTADGVSFEEDDSDAAKDELRDPEALFETNDIELTDETNVDASLITDEEVFLQAPTQERWEGMDKECWISARGMSSSRVGRNYVHVPEHSEFAGARGVPRLSTAKQKAAAGGVSGVSGSLSRGDSQGEVDFLDMNGDRFPDILGKSGIQYTRPDGGFEQYETSGGEIRQVRPYGGLGVDLSPLRKGENDTRNAGVGAGNPARSEQDAKGRVGATGSTARSDGEQGSQMVQLGVSGGLGTGSSSPKRDLIDINGDGLPDRVWEDGGIMVEFNQGYRFGPPEEWSSTPNTISESTSDNLNVGLNAGYNDGSYGFAGGASVTLATGRTNELLQDVNGDGLVDYVEWREDQDDEDYWSVAFNTGADFAPSVEWRGVLSGDVIRSSTRTAGGGAYFTISIGPLCYACCYIIVNPGADACVSMARPERALVDVNGDGYPDHVRSESDAALTVALNRTGRTNLLKRVKRPLGATIDLEYERDGNTFDLPQSRWNLSRVEVQDGHSGDGVDTIVRSFRYDGGRYDRREREFYGYASVVDEHPLPASAGGGPDLYRKTTRTFRNGSYYERGLLETSRFEDGNGNAYMEESNSYVLVDIDANAPVLDAVTATAAIFPQLVQTDQLFFEGQADPGKTTHTTFSYDTYGNIVGFFDAGDAGEADDIRADVTYFTDVDLDTGVYIVGHPESIVVMSNGEVLRRREADFEPGTGNMLALRRYVDLDGECAGGCDGAGPGACAVTCFEYEPNGNLRRVIGSPNANAERYTIDLGYDAETATHVTSIIDSFDYASTATYDLRFGATDVTTDINGNRMDYDYDAFGRVSAIRGPYETAFDPPTLAFEYHPSDDDPWALTRHIDRFRNIDDPIETVLITDGLKRVIQTKEDSTIHVPGGGTEDVMVVSGRVVYDHQGRAIAEHYPVAEPLGNAGGYNEEIDDELPTRTTYDVLDRPTSITRPDETSTTLTFGFAPDRDGVVRFSSVVTDANANVKRFYRDVRDLMRGVEEINTIPATAENPEEVQAIWTRYDYDPLSQLVGITDDHGNQTVLEYDPLGRSTKVTTPDTGLTERRYDLAGNVIAKITPNLDAVGEQITYEYDFVRLREIRYPLSPENNVTYTYGGLQAPFNRTGRVAAVSYEGGASERFYGKLGEVVKEIATIASDTGSESTPEVYATEFTYDTWSRLQSMIYPDGEVLTYDYDSGGRLAAAAGVKNGFDYDYVRRLEYDKFGQRAFIEFMNGVETDYTYDPATRRLANLTSITPGGQLFQNLGYGYDAVGNILRLHNDVSVPPPSGMGGPVEQTFAYDDLYRLVEAHGTFQHAPNKLEQYDLTLAYDRIHNITQKNQWHAWRKIGGKHGSGLGHGNSAPTGRPHVQRKTTYDWMYDYDGPHAHAPSHVGERAFTYDANGNQVGWDHDQTGRRRTIVWDEENRVQSVADNGRTERYKYDDQGRRVVKRGPGGETAYVNQYMTARNRSLWTKHIFAGETRVASKLTPGQGQAGANPSPDGTPEINFLYFLHPDHLGSTAFVTDEDGELYEHIQYFPFGEMWVQEKSNARPIPYLFTSQVLDDTTGLYYYGARYYDPVVSQFLSADSLYADPPSMSDEQRGRMLDEPRSLNLYAYVWNRPLTYRDPTGNDPDISCTDRRVPLPPSSPSQEAQGAQSPTAATADPTAVETLLPEEGPGYSTKPASRRQGRLYGTPRMIELLQEVGRRWDAAHPDGQRMFIGDISQQGGGELSPHNSHREGLDVDIAVFRNDGVEGYRQTEVTRPNYSRELTQELVSIIREVGGDDVHLMLSADRELTGTNYESNHTWHIHVRLRSSPAP